jgi:hypothetical protein
MQVQKTLRMCRLLNLSARTKNTQKHIQGKVHRGCGAGWRRHRRPLRPGNHPAAHLHGQKLPPTTMSPILRVEHSMSEDLEAQPPPPRRLRRRPRGTDHQSTTNRRLKKQQGRGEVELPQRHRPPPVKPSASAVSDSRHDEAAAKGRAAPLLSSTALLSPPPLTPLGY